MKEHSTPEKIEDIEIRLLLEALYGRYHYDFRNYAMASIKRRLKQAREQLGFVTFSALQESHLAYLKGQIPQKSRQHSRIVQQARLELKYLAGGIEIDKSYAVSEDVVYPPDIDWFGRHFKLAVQQTLVKAVTRPKHQLVRATSHR